VTFGIGFETPSNPISRFARNDARDELEAIFLFRLSACPPVRLSASPPQSTVATPVTINAAAQIKSRFTHAVRRNLSPTRS
jgi:hypothetical protein